MSLELTRRQIQDIIEYLMESGLCDDQNFPIHRQVGISRHELSFNNASDIVLALKQRPYSDIYDEFRSARAYNALLPDGALLQMTYAFEHGALLQHRLAFFPAPHLLEFQNNPEIYLEDVVYAEVVAKNIVPFPLRFDYDNREGIFVELEHPKSHLSLGQYENCRIPVSAPLTPVLFTDFILRNFYHSAFLTYADGLPAFAERFDDCITELEGRVLHLRIHRRA